jgi:zinc and cadmium transporter
MSELYQVILFSLAGGVLSLIGGVALIKQSTKKQVINLATAFAAGALLAAAFFDLLVEAVEEGSAEQALQFCLVGIIGFFLLEQFLRWFHHHRPGIETDPSLSLIIIGDTLHNVIDGLAIGAAFLVNPATGIVTTAAVAAHEIPHEIGDFSLMLKKGASRAKVIIINVLSALATTVAAVGIFLVGSAVVVPLSPILAVAGGFFIYIAVSDIIPTINQRKQSKLLDPQVVFLLLGILVVAFVQRLLHDLIGH